MKNIIDVYEASLLGDIEDTMKSGDDLSTLMNNIEKEFNLIKKLNINTFRKGNDEYRWYCPNFLKMCLGTGDYIVFTLNVYVADDTKETFVYCGMFVVDEKNLMNSNDIDCVTTGKLFKTRTLALEDLVKSIKKTFKFKDLQKLSKHVKTETKMSKLDLSWD
jgi:hypothetical protein